MDKIKRNTSSGYQDQTVRLHLEETKIIELKLEAMKRTVKYEGQKFIKKIVAKWKRKGKSGRRKKKSIIKEKGVEKEEIKRKRERKETKRQLK